MNNLPRRNANPPAGCAFIALGLWLVGVLLTIGFWVLVAYGIWEGIQWLQRH